MRRRVRRRRPLPLLDLRRGDRGPAAGEPARGDHPGLRTQPDRPGRRVRLLLRARVVRAVATRGFRDGHGQLQPRDRQSTDYDTSAASTSSRSRLEDVLEVVDTSRRQAGPIAGVIVQLGGQTPLGLAQALHEGRADRRHQPGRPSTSPRTAARSGELLAAGRAAASPRARHRIHAEEARSEVAERASATRCSCGPRTCSAAPAWRSSTTSDELDDLRCCADRRLTASEHPVLVDRFLDDAHRDRRRRARSTARRCHPRRVMEHIEEAGDPLR